MDNGCFGHEEIRASNRQMDALHNFFLFVCANSYHLQKDDCREYHKTLLLALQVRGRWKV
jgi:hypothetical protein